MANVLSSKYQQVDLLASHRAQVIHSGTHIEQGRKFLNEHRRRPELYRMSSQPSRAHLDAVDLVEKHAKKQLDAEIKRLVEKPDAFIGKDKEESLIETI